jgi:tetratricopeptide (TPR) repeat protein
MAIKGSLKEASLPDVLQLLAMGQKNGCLSVTDRANFGYIYFDRGRITYAAIVNRRDRLGDLLVKNGLIEAEELAAAIDAQALHPEKRLGEILIERSSITRDQLAQYIRIQIEEAVYYLFTWNQGSFYFEAEQRPEEGAMLVSINPENLLLEGARRIDEWSLIEKKIPSLDLIFDLERSREIPPETELTEEQRKIVPLLDGQRSVQELIDESGLVEFDVGKALFGLIQAGFAHTVGRQRPSEQREVPAARIDEHRNLGVAFYRTAMFDEATREFKRVGELQPENLEARFFLALVGLRRGDAKSAIRYFKEMLESGGPKASAFHNLGLALEQLGRLGDARVVVEEALRLAPRHPSVLLSRAIVLLKEGHVAEAVSAFDEYREGQGSNRPPAAYFAFTVLALAAAGEPGRAREIGKEGLELHPHCAPLLLHLGAVHERGGDWDQAEAYYRRAAEEGAELAQAHKALADSLYRRGVYEEAAEAYQRAIKLSPQLGDDVYFKLGNIHYKQMEREQAVKLWHRALELNPRNKVVRTNLELVEGALAGPGVAPGAR